jgi:hypothetical protein
MIDQPDLLSLTRWLLHFKKWMSVQKIARDSYQEAPRSPKVWGFEASDSHFQASGRMAWTLVKMALSLAQLIARLAQINF